MSYKTILIPVLLFAVIFSGIGVITAEYGTTGTTTQDARIIKTRLLNTDNVRALQQKQEEKLRLNEERRAEFEKKIQEKVETSKMRALELRANEETRTNKLYDRASSTASSTKDRIAARRAKLTEERQARIMAFFKRMFARIEAGFERMSRLVERVESRIVKLEEKNKNIKTTEAKAFLNDARVSISAGLATLSSIEEKAKDIVSGNDDPKVSFEEVRALLRESTQDLKDAHKSIKNAIRSIKAQPGATDNDNNNATSTNNGTGTTTATTTSN